MKLSERKREDILNAAIVEFQEQGFVAARISRIGERANVSSRTLYRHFASKEVLFEAIVNIVFAECDSRPVDDLKPDQPLHDQLVSAVEKHIESITGERFIGLSRILMAEFIRNTALAQRALEKIANVDNTIKHMIRQAMDSGLLRKENPDYAAQQLIAMIKSYYYLPVIVLGQEQAFDKSKAEVISDCVCMFLAHYKS